MIRIGWAQISNDMTQTECFDQASSHVLLQSQIAKQTKMFMYTIGIFVWIVFLCFTINETFCHKTGLKLYLKGVDYISKN